MSSDQIADMFTCLRNARARNCQTTAVPYSNFKWKICQELTKEGLLDCWVKLQITKKGLNVSLEEKRLVINSSPLQKLIIPQDLKVTCSKKGQIHIQGTNKTQIGEFTSSLLKSLKNIHASIKMEVSQNLNQIKKISKASQEVFFDKKKIKEKCLGKWFYLISTSVSGSEVVLVGYKNKAINFGGKVIGLIRKN